MKTTNFKNVSKLTSNSIKTLFEDKSFIIFILFVFIFYIFFYEYINDNTKKQLFLTFTNPIILIISILLQGFILYHNFTIGIIISIAIVITITYNSNCILKKNNIVKKTKYSEGFKNKGFLMSKIEQLTNNFQEGLEENKDIINKYKNKLNKNNTKNDIVINNNKNKNKNNGSKDNNIEITKRKFDFTKREDKALVYSREVLKDCIKRINYEYDDKEYLKKYIGSKIEEIIDLLGLVNNE